MIGVSGRGFGRDTLYKEGSPQSYFFESAFVLRCVDNLADWTESTIFNVQQYSFNADGFVPVLHLTVILLRFISCIGLVLSDTGHRL